jgi:hypothetical protein
MTRPILNKMECIKLENKYPSSMVTIEGTEYQLVLGGDKGYPCAPLPAGWYWYITKSGEDSKNVNDQGVENGESASSSNLPNVIFDPGFARLRSVVDRSIERIKGWPIFSPLHHMNSEKRTKELLLISIGLLKPSSKSQNPNSTIQWKSKEVPLFFFQNSYGVVKDLMIFIVSFIV